MIFQYHSQALDRKLKSHNLATVTITAWRYAAGYFTLDFTKKYHATRPTDIKNANYSYHMPVENIVAFIELLTWLQQNHAKTRKT